MNWDTKLVDLKKEFLAAKDFGKLWIYFFDHFGDSAAFHRLGRPADDPNLEATLLAVAREVMERPDLSLRVKMTKIPKYGFRHGACAFNGGHGTFFVFDDLKSGLVGFVDHASNQSFFARITPGSISSILPKSSLN